MVISPLQVDASGKRRVWAVMKNGERWEGDILVGADGIHSKVGYEIELVYKMPCLLCFCLQITSRAVALLGS